MSGVGQKPLSLVEVARVVFRTPHPSDQQIGRVFERMKAGVLHVHQRGRTPWDWTTTEASLAEFMANEMLKRQKFGGQPTSAARAATSLSTAQKKVQSTIQSTILNAVQTERRAPARLSSGAARQQRVDADDMRGVYRGIWRDYFLAVMLRKRIAHRSVSFHRAVLAGQVVVLLSIVVLVLGVSHSFERTPPERIAIKRYLAAQTDSHFVERWFPSQAAESGEGLLVEVEYRYTKESTRAIHTRRTFRVLGDDVSEVSDE